MNGSSICENIWNIFPIISAVFPPIWVINMGTHCNHVHEPIDRTCGVCHRNRIYYPPDVRQGNVGIPILIGHTEIYRYTYDWDIHFGETKHSG